MNIKMTTDNLYYENSNVAEVYDDLPFWSAPFGMKLLDNIIFKSGIKVLDVGCGTGFPLLEISQRLGSSCKLIGIDPWEKGIERTRKKILIKNIKNTKVIKGVSENIPFNDDFFDMIVSNNGISVTKNKKKAIEECFRVCKPKGSLIFTVILPEMMNEFYKIFTKAMKESGVSGASLIINQHINAKRKGISFYKKELKNAGFKIKNSKTDKFCLKFLDAEAIFNHFFFRLCFIEDWKKIVSNFKGEQIIKKVKEKLNLIGIKKGKINLTIPFACIHCEKL